MRPFVQAAGGVRRERERVHRLVFRQAQEACAAAAAAPTAPIEPRRAEAPRELLGDERLADSGHDLVADDAGGDELAARRTLRAPASASSAGQTTTPMCDTLAVCMSSCTSPCAAVAFANAASATLARAGEPISVALVAAHRRGVPGRLPAPRQIARLPPRCRSCRAGTAFSLFVAPAVERRCVALRESSARSRAPCVGSLRVSVGRSSRYPSPCVALSGGR